MAVQNLQNEKKIVLDYFNDVDNCKNEDSCRGFSGRVSRRNDGLAILVAASRNEDRTERADRPHTRHHT